MPRNNKLNYRFLKGGDIAKEGGKFAKDGYEKVKKNKVLSIIVSIIIILLIIFIIYSIWKAIYKNQSESNVDCTPAKGCVLFSGVKNGTEPVTISADRMPPSISGTDHTLCVWLYVRSSIFSHGQKKWKTIMYRGNQGDTPKMGTLAGNDEQFSVQPGVWLNGNTNKLLIRWETLGRIANISNFFD